MRVLLDIILLVLNFYTLVVFIMVIMSWLLAFNVINGSNQFVATIWRAVTGLTEPLLAPIRRYMPNLSGIDISPLILLLAVYAIRQAILYYVYPYTF